MATRATLRIAAGTACAMALAAVAQVGAADAPAAKERVGFAADPAVHQAAQVRRAPDRLRRAAPRPIASRPTSSVAWRARVVVPIHPRTAPRASARKLRLLNGQAPYNGNPEVLLVMGATTSVKHGVWYKVLLNSRPNDAAAWVPEAAVRVTRTRLRVLVDISSRTISVFRADRRVVRWRVAVGTRLNPTPEGRFAISEIVRQRNPRGFFGPVIMTLTAHSEKLNDFDGGDGRIALHGTSRPRLLGRAVSHGCVRLANRDIVRLARVASPGTPVDIVA
ncbi:MAG: L,D-transpeptidase [Miltoncostaeaceae bacterium]